MGLLKVRPDEGVWLTRLKVLNFRSIASLELKFDRRVTLLIGANGAGKTTILDAISVALGTRPESRRFADPDRRVVDRKHAGETLVELSAWDQTPWFAFGGSRGPHAKHLVEFVPPPVLWDSSLPPFHNPGVNAYYGAERDYGSSFADLVEWLAAKDVEENRRTGELVDKWFGVGASRGGRIPEPGDLRYRDPELEKVRTVVTKMIRGTSNLRIDPSTNQLVTDQLVGSRTETFEVGQLAGGLRTMLVLVADLARMIVAAAANRRNPRAVVLIDELDLHLHPRWQLDIVANLLDAFPEAQFIVTTHSEEIIASVPSECVVSLQSTVNGLEINSVPPVQGATFDRVLEDAMGVPSRRPREAQEMLDRYWKLIDGGEGETVEAKGLRAELDELFKGQEPELVKADVAIRLSRARRATGS